MKRSLFALAAFSLLTSSAQADSSVTLYGVVDNNIEYVSNLATAPGGPAGNAVRLTSGGLSGSRFGLRGVEELGGGVNALFVLENGFGTDDGKLQQGGRMFGRQAYVGMEYSGFGRVTFGRQYTTLFSMLADFSPTAYSQQYEPYVVLLGINARSDNTIKYNGVFGPVTAIAHWTFGNGVYGGGEVPGQFRRDTGYGAGLSYSAGPFGASIAYDQFNPTLNAAGDTGTFKKAGAAASYTVGAAKLMAGYRWGRNSGANGATSLRDDYYWLGTNYQVTPALGLTLAYYYDDVKSLSGVNVKNPWQISFMADYSFSKRTDVYFTTAYVKNAGLDFDSSANSFADGYYLGAGKNSMLGAAIGIRHKF